MATWPEYPTTDNPFFGDGQSYGREMGRVSPEGNVLGQRRFIRDVEHWIWYDGTGWKNLELAGTVDRVEDLPTTQRPFGEVWGVKGEYDPVTEKWRGSCYYWDSLDRSFKLIKFLWTIKNLNEIPAVGLFVGEAHRLLEPDVEVRWNGYEFRRPPHSGLDDDEPNRHIPRGFISLLAPNSELRFITPVEIGIEANAEGTGYESVAGDRIVPLPSCSVFNTCPVLSLTIDGTIEADYLHPDTEYWIYLANTLSDQFSVGALTGDPVYEDTAAWDFRGKLFLSTTEPDGQYMAASGVGRNAKLAGRIRTEVVLDSNRFPRFARGIDISLISRRPNIVGAFRDYSDYRVVFVNQNVIELQKLDGRYGEIFVPDSLQCLGEGQSITVDDPKVVVDANGNVSLGATNILSNTTYYIYLPTEIDQFNFNSINPDTNRPWWQDDEGAADNYEFLLDLRLKPFLTTKAPMHRQLTDTWPGFYARWIGMVKTDGNGKFRPSTDISEVAPPQLDPISFDGLAEIRFVVRSETEFVIAKKRGSSGYIHVGGEYVQTYTDYDTNTLAVKNADFVQTYSEANPSAPLTDGTRVWSHPGEMLHCYIANSRSLWGPFAGKPFLCSTAPTEGYLSKNWPGNQARWVAAIKIHTTGRFVGTFILDSIAPTPLLINDDTPTADTTFSGLKIQSLYNALLAQMDAAQVYELQKTQGCPLRLLINSHHSLKLVPVGAGTVTIVTPNLHIIEVDSDGIVLNAQSMVDSVFYYVYLGAGGLTISGAGPTTTYEKLAISGNTILVGYVAFGDFDLTEERSTSQFTIATQAPQIATFVMDSARYGHFVDSVGSRLTLGPGNSCPYVGKMQKVCFADGYRKILRIVGNGSADNAVEIDSDHVTAAVTGIYGLESTGVPTTAIEYDGTLLRGSRVYANAWDCSAGQNPGQAFDNSTADGNGWNAGAGSGASITAKFTNATILNGCYAQGMRLLEVVRQEQQCIRWENEQCVEWGMVDIWDWVYYGPTSLKVEASNDNGQTWTVLQASGSANTNWYNSTAYKWYRFTVLAGSSRIAELFLYSPTAQKPPWTPSLVYLNDAQAVAPTWWSIWNQLVPSETKTGSSTIHYAFSNNGGTVFWIKQADWRAIVQLDAGQWKYHDGTQWQNAALNDRETALFQALTNTNNHMTGTQLAALSNISFNPATKIHLAAVVTCDYFGAVSFSGAAWKFEEHDRIAGEWAVWSYWNQPAWTIGGSAQTGNHFRVHGILLPPGVHLSAWRDGYDEAWATFQINTGFEPQPVNYCGCDALPWTGGQQT